MPRRFGGATLVATLAAALGLAACGGGGPAPPQARTAQLATLTVTPERIPLERVLDGVVEAVNQSTVSAQTAGRVAEILYDVNDSVLAGAVIMRLRSAEQRSGLTQAQAALSEAEAREAEAQNRFQRITDMYARRVVAKAMLDEATAGRDAAVARLAAARAALASAREGVGYTEVRAPFAGVVTQRHVEVGEAVTPGTPLMSGASLAQLRVAVEVPQSLVARVRASGRAGIHAGDRRIEASALTIFPVAASPSSSFRARLELPEGASGLAPGMFVKVGFVVGEAQRLLVPAGSLVERSEVTAVYVVNADGRALLRQVRVGRRHGERLEILAGLAAGEHVATDPIAAMKHLAPVTRPGGNGA